MSLKGKHIGFGLTGSHCTYDAVLPEMQKLVDLGAKVTPFVTYTVESTDTKFGDSADWLTKIKEITSEPIVNSIVKAEPFGPKTPLDCMVVAPITGNSTSKFANALTDSPVLMGAKATLRNGNPVVLGISTNDALGLNGVNIMRLMATKNIYFIPFGQDDPVKKPNSLVARMEALVDTVESALAGVQYQPVLVEKFKD
ncbi:dipicolinate synthase subunit B [Alkalihalophilus pseudofirmus OF4]|uniref:Dipicolinate synthase subunit B n=2 Tax=Alkalihalophilus pseudofirmus TaxID=79885 RepID=D3FTZ3_ALKPO|nr:MULTISPECIES: dipicolinate synthase subunit B [Alkalihalophilus]ADC51974.1 dipicolinate synthase subunit B [Alkalihalophilus pseudofirmus OF4]MDV2885222.1 dipicolinate synthase subunit B [Alkalihalophilus pseudofirmus]MED1602340.1 dipicolinate synthase subunit B [Alkalihalophilus marmarensis]OLS37522.1 dipicolinate synthase subunit B [Alkalihalophilus pseudofirmus]WEG15572.1 dipicolinate synthase subunit B [Alkalihalophilus pseudofirmus]